MAKIGKRKRSTEPRTLSSFAAAVAAASETGRQTTPCRPQTTTPVYARANCNRDHADSWVFRSTLEHEKVAAKTAPPPSRIESGPLGLSGQGEPEEEEGEAEPSPPHSKP